MYNNQLLLLATSLCRSVASSGFYRFNCFKGHRMLPFGLSIIGPLSKAVGENCSVEKMLCLETYRLKTFEDWPVEAHDNVRPMELARNGFYYTGQNDIVKCFSCGVQKGQWGARSKPKQVHEHLNPHCSYLRGADERNVPILVPDEEVCKSIYAHLHEKYCRDTEESRQQPFSSLGTSGAFSSSSSSSSGSSSSRSDSNGQYHSNVSQPLLPVHENAFSPTSFNHVDSSRHESSTPVLSHLHEENLQQMSEMVRLQTFEGRWPRVFPSPLDLAKAGFTFTGSADRVECAFCKGILKNWADEDNPMFEHAKHFPSCAFVKEYKEKQEQQNNNRPVQLAPGNLNFREIECMPSEPSRQNPGSFSPEDGIHTEKPRHPHYVTEASRIATYTSWPSGKSQTPQQLAKAGFIYIGVDDNVKCFFCDGGLRKWERGDDPWEEHAKYFPRCQYVLQVKGEAFVQQTQNSTVTSQATGNGATGSQSNQTFESEIIAEKINLPVVQDVLKMGVPKDTVVNVIKERFQTTGVDFNSVSDLLNAIYHRTDASHIEAGEKSQAKNEVEQSHKEENTEKNITVLGDTESNADHESLLIENRRLKEQRTCKICMDEEANIVLLPCGHLVSCATCSPALRMCPICRAPIKGTVRTYLS